MPRRAHPGDSAQFRPVIAAPVAEEFARAVSSKTAHLPAADVQRIWDAVKEWERISRCEHLPVPSEAEMMTHAGLISAVRHRNDMPSVVAAVLARPDWVLSTNARHWNQALAARTGLQISTPLDFLSRLRP